jgi:hypothetical protein
LTGIVAGDQNAANVTSAIALADAAYYTALSSGTGGPPTVASGANDSANVTAPAGGTVKGGATIGDVLFTFPSGNAVCVFINPTGQGASPSQVAGAATPTSVAGC